MTKFSLKVEADLKDKFDKACRKDDTDMSKELRKFMRRFVRRSENTEETDNR